MIFSPTICSSLRSSEGPFLIEIKKMMLAFQLASLALLAHHAIGYNINGHNIIGRNRSTSDASDLLQRGIEALGGLENISKISSVAYLGEKQSSCYPLEVSGPILTLNRVYRSKTMIDSFSLTKVDHGIAIKGTQNFTFSYEQPLIKQRVDRLLDLDRMGFLRNIFHTDRALKNF